MAGKPNPERELERLQRTLEAGVPPVVGILGTSDFFRNEAFETVLAAIDAAAEVRAVDGQDKTDGRELDDLRGASLFGAGSWLVVRRAGAWLKAHGAALEAVLERRRPSCGLLFEVAKLDRRTKLARVVGEAGELFEFRDLYAEPYDRSRSPLEAELVGWVVQRARRLGLQLAPEAAFLVVSTAGTEPAEIVAELDRLAPVLGRGRIGPDTLRVHLSCTFESTPFEFAEAVLAHDRRRAERSLRAMFARGIRGRDGASVDSGGVFPFVVTWLHQSLTRARDGRLLADSGVPLRDVPHRVGVRVFEDRFRAQVEVSTCEWLTGALHALHDCERRLRSTGEDPEWLLGSFVSRCLGGAA